MRLRRKGRPIKLGPIPVDTLARYNSEVARGIVHTAEYDERMATLQAEYDAQQRRQAEGEGARIIELPNGGQAFFWDHPDVH